MKKVLSFVIVVLILSGISYFIWGTDKYHPLIPSRRQAQTIVVQPFDDIPRQQAKYVFENIRKVYSNTILAEPIKLPANSYYRPRNRYRADTIIQWLSRNTKSNFVTIGLTASDVSTNKDKITDWGVMGLGFQPGNACVVSTFRLSKKNLLDQFYKVCIHELGHTQGLAHCENKTCFMRDAEGRNTTDEEFEFCSKCKERMLDKGWIFAK